MRRPASSAGADSPPPPRRSRGRRIVLAVAVLLALLLAIAAIRVAPLLLEGNPYAGTPSVEQTAVFRNAALMRQAWALPAASAYREGGFLFQHNPSFCGPASLANVMRSLGTRIDQDTVLDGTTYDPWFGILVGGMTLDALAEVGRLRIAAPVEVLRGGSLAEFRDRLRLANRRDTRLILNFHRGPLFGRGHGHFSPLLAYLEAEDLVLVGDVNREYQPFLASAERLWRASRTIDRDTGLERGLLRIGPVPGLR